MFGVGFINPYGYKSIIYIFKSYNVPLVNQYVTEMHPETIKMYYGKIIFDCIIILIFILNKYKCKISLNHYMLLIGTLYLSLGSIKAFPYFIISFSLIFCNLLNKINFDYIKKILSMKNKNFAILKHLFKVIYSTTLVLLIPSLIYGYFTGLKNLKYDNNVIKDLVSYIIKEYDSNDVILYSDYEDGGYCEYKGLKTYIDPRADVFLKSNNNKKDIFKEYYEIHDDKGSFDYEKFVKKYNFTHLIVDTDSNFDKYLLDNKNYELKYKQKLENNVVKHLYVLK